MPAIHAYAKINLGLEVVGRRPDGFHELCSVFARVELHDTLLVRPAPELGVRWPAGTLAPQDDLIRRAGVLLREATGSTLGARIHLQKAIPMAAGLGGGSSDAAAALYALNELWSTGCSAAELRELAGRLGSDVPFFLGASPTLATGRGDQLQALSGRLNGWLVIIAPSWDMEAKTATLYRALEPADFSDGSHARSIAQSLDVLTQGRMDLPNAFERVIDGVFPQWSQTRQAAERNAGVHFWLSGAGPAMYALAQDLGEAERVAVAVRPLGHPTLLTRFTEGALRLVPDS